MTTIVQSLRDPPPPKEAAAVLLAMLLLPLLAVLLLALLAVLLLATSLHPALEAELLAVEAELLTKMLARQRPTSLHPAELLAVEDVEAVEDVLLAVEDVLLAVEDMEAKLRRPARRRRKRRRRRSLLKEEGDKEAVLLLVQDVADVVKL